MKKIILFKTISNGGMEVLTKEERLFETEDMARFNALSDFWNDTFYLYKVTLTFQGRVTKEEKLIGRIDCGREIKRKLIMPKGEIVTRDTIISGVEQMLGKGFVDKINSYRAFNYKDRWCKFRAVSLGAVVDYLIYEYANANCFGYDGVENTKNDYEAIEIVRKQVNDEEYCSYKDVMDYLANILPYSIYEEIEI